ncbi:unnamed protein product [Candida verbasci]|uniref:Homeobox domain-containing protein n=1 Tax=Candida verbasci TaxID=1227364 RepID=A0A9W4TYV8_9ASCO|nr:unnamed protein product [Candida verbasci]
MQLTTTTSSTSTINRPSPLPSISHHHHHHHHRSSNNNILPPIHQLKSISLPPISDILKENNNNHQKSPLSSPNHILPSVTHLYPQSQSQSQSQHQQQHGPNQPQQYFNYTHQKQNTSTIQRNNSINPVNLVNDGSSNNSGSRRTRNNLPKEITYILLRWLHDHINHPYPNSFEKNQLMMATGLNQQQLSNWFINARRRKIKTIKEQKRLNLV